MPKYLGDVRCWVNSGKHVLALSFSGFDLERTSAEGQALALLALPEGAFAARVSF